MFTAAFTLLTLLATALPSAAQSTSAALCSKGRLASVGACCVWFDVLDDLQANLFNNGKCENGVHKVLRIVFHDSIGFSPSLEAAGRFGGGGSDGSIIEHVGIEQAFPANGPSIVPTVEILRSIALKHGVSFADIMQFSTAAGISNCAGAPRLDFLAGRANSSQPSPAALIPGPGNNVTQILTRMGDAGFSAEEVVFLLSSHSIAAQEGLNGAIKGSPFDSTPSVYDTQFFIETLLKGTIQIGPSLGFAELLSPLPGEFRMQSDFALARDPRTACFWQSLVKDPVRMAEGFRKAMNKMALLGQDKSTLINCSGVIPIPRRNTRPATLPAGKSLADIEASCAETPFPNLPVAPGALPTIPPVAV